MAMAIYKPGQGYWTRVLTACGAGTLILCAAGWLWNLLETLDSEQRMYIQAAVVVALIAVGGGILFWLLNKPNIVDFMIATEAEMRKVNWPSKREIIGSTIVVIVGTLAIAVLLFVTDIAFSELFNRINVLEGKSVLSELFAGS